ncbi:MAG: 30S ribosomal protein S7 [Candidatus Aenigmarchaeota archaeon]|nr:30S ribosomal protein S7 [Candidatus Aenigmarchaeota archaeon]
MKLFGRWDTEGIQIRDRGLERYINITPIIVPKTGGRNATQQFHKSHMPIVERLINKIMVPGHRSKKHIISSGRVVGKYLTAYNIVKNAFERVEEVTKKNPVEVLVHAIENSATREEIAGYQVGGMIVRRAVITSPQRRVDLALKIFAQTSYRRSFGKKETMTGALAEEIIAAYNNDASKSEAIKERERIERESEGAR